MTFINEGACALSHFLLSLGRPKALCNYPLGKCSVCKLVKYMNVILIYVPVLHVIDHLRTYKILTQYQLHFGTIFYLLVISKWLLNETKPAAFRPVRTGDSCFKSGSRDSKNATISLSNCFGLFLYALFIL